jgi:MFS family permease
MPRSGPNQIRSRAGQVARVTGQHLQRTLGGQQRTRVIVTLAAILALSSADASTVGAAASPLRTALHIGNTDIGLLVTVSSLIAALASLPFGVMADRFRRTRILGLAVATWGGAMIWSATVSTFGGLVLARIVLGAVTAAAGPMVASLVGDYFDGSERGRIYSYILTGELVGAGIGFAVTGDIAALSWRAAFILLALPAFVLAWFVLRLPEPTRGALAPLRADGHPAGAAGTAGDPTLGDPTLGDPALGDTKLGDPTLGGSTLGGEATSDDTTGATDAQRLAATRGVTPDLDKVLSVDKLQRMGIVSAVRAVLLIRTNVILIVAGACGYFYLSGVETFGSEFAREQFKLDQALANFLLLIVGGGAVVGVLVSGHLSDRLLKRGFLNSRILVAALCALGATVLFIPALTTRSAVTALPYLILAGVMLSAQNPPIDAARLDIVPALLWGRAEATRTVLRSLAQSLAPLLFGAVSDHVFGGGRRGLQWTFGIMLIAMAASGVILLRALRTYPRDVATAAESVLPSAATSDSPAAAGRAAAAGETLPVQAPPNWPNPAPPAPPVPPVRPGAA